MVGVSTEQNTANMVPFVQFGGESLVLAETDVAHAAGWSRGLTRVLAERGKKSCMIDIGAGDNIGLMAEKLAREVESVSSVCWNFGGGQKMQQVALFDLFSRRIQTGKKDWACYTEPQTRSTYVITVDDHGKLQSHRIETNAHLTLKEIILIFGNTPGKHCGTCLWNRAKLEQERLNQHECLSAAQAAWLEDYDKRQKMFAHYDLQEVPPPEEQRIFPDSSRKLGQFFEKAVQFHVADIIAKCPKEHRVNEVWANVEVFSEKRNGQVAEYDVLLVTSFGTIIPLDAKSYEFSNKDEHARLHNLRSISGRYTTIYSVFPYFTADLGSGSILQQHRDWKKLLQRPFEMKARGSRMLVVSEKGQKSFIIARGRKNKIVLAEKEGKRTVQVHTLENMLDKLQLKHQSS